MAASADNSCDFLPSGSTHPSFAADDADIVLCSQDGVHFRTHTLVLKLGSAWFRTLFTLPQAASSPRPDSAPPPEPQTIQMPESAAVLADLLSMISGQPLPLARWTSPDALALLIQVTGARRRLPRQRLSTLTVACCTARRVPASLTTTTYAICPSPLPPTWTCIRSLSWIN